MHLKLLVLGFYPFGVLFCRRSFGSAAELRSGYRSLDAHLNLSKSIGTLGTSSSALIHLPPPFLIPFLLLGASALGLRLEQCLTKLSLALSWGI